MALLYLPKPQATHTEGLSAPTAPPHVPRAQLTQLEGAAAASAVEYVPAAQGRHAASLLAPSVAL